MKHPFKLKPIWSPQTAPWRLSGLRAAIREYFRYHGVLAPLVRLMRDVDFHYKALLVSAAFAVPSSCVVSMEISDQWHNYQQAQQQREGWSYIKQVDKLIMAISPRRASIEGADNQSDKTSNAALLRDIENSYLDLAALQDLAGNQFGAAKEWQALSEAYVNLNVTPPAGKTRADMFSELVAHARKLSGIVRDGAQLNVSTSQRNQFLIELGTDLLPHLDEAVYQLHAQLPALIKQTDRTPSSTEQVLLRANDLRETLERVKSHASQMGDQGALSCVKASEPIFAEGVQFAHEMRAFALDGGAFMNPTKAVTTTQALHKNVQDLRKSCFATLETALVASEAQIEQRMYWLTGLVTLGGLLAAYVMMAFSHVMRGGMQLIQSEVSRMARGDLTWHASARGDDEVAHTLRSLRTSLSRLAELFTVVRRGVSSVSHASGDISAASEDLAQRIQEATDAMSSLQQGISATLDYLEVNQQCVAQAVDRAKDVIADAGRSRRAMTHLAKVIDDLQGRSREIGKIVSLIDGIAFQTNLLALNASVEAAKAGTTGKGFAVVASEVRSLAQRVSDAAAQINKVVSDSTNEISRGQEIARDTVAAVLSTESNVNEMGHILGKLADVTANGRSNAELMTNTLCTVNDNSEKTNELIVQVAHAAKELRYQSLKLTEQASRFKLG